MTINEFLDDYVPRVLKPLKGWKLSGAIRLGQSCPLTAESGLGANSWREEYVRLGLKSFEASDIAMAADFTWFGADPELKEIRRRLLVGLGLKKRAK